MICAYSAPVAPNDSTAVCPVSRSKADAIFSIGTAQLPATATCTFSANDGLATPASLVDTRNISPASVKRRGVGVGGFTVPTPAEQEIGLRVDVITNSSRGSNRPGWSIAGSSGAGTTKMPAVTTG